MSLPSPTSGSAALITGAWSGIGAAIAEEIAQRGHNLVLVARRKAKLEQLGHELEQKHGIRAEAVSCDLAKPTARARLPKQLDTLGLQVDILVNNAGFATGGPFHASDPEQELQQVRLDVEAVVALTSMFLPGMVENRRGAVLNVASTAGMQPLPYSAGYSAAKAYVLTFSEAIHEEVGRRGVTVTALCPGPVSTDFWEIAGWQAAGQPFEQAVPKVAWVTAEVAARAGVEGLEAGRRVVVPGTAIRATMLASRYIPNFIKLPSIAAAMRRR
jgi:short-subunit dehydrogenase